MELSVARQLAELIYAVVFGACSGLFYDILRVIRAVLPGKAVFTVICDAVFWLIELPLAFLFNMIILSGELRWHVLIGMFIGGIIYFVFPGKLMKKANKGLRRALTKIFRTTNSGNGISKKKSSKDLLK